MVVNRIDKDERFIGLIRAALEPAEFELFIKQTSGSRIYIPGMAERGILSRGRKAALAELLGQKIADKLIALMPADAGGRLDVPLSSEGRERRLRALSRLKVERLLNAGMSADRIANKLKISERTVYRYKATLKSKNKQKA